MLRFSRSGEEANRSNSYLHKAAFAQPSGITLTSGSYTYYAVPFDLYQSISVHFSLSYTITSPSTIILSIISLFSLFHHSSQYPREPSMGMLNVGVGLVYQASPSLTFQKSERGSSLMPS